MITDEFFMLAIMCGTMIAVALVLLFRPKSILDEKATHSDMLTIERFQLRRHRALKYAVIPLVISAVCVALLGKNSPAHGFLGLTGYDWFTQFFVMLCWTIVYLTLVYLCPACGQMPMVGPRTHRRVALDPSVCGNCGAKLKEGHIP